jgi:membrane protein YdbS with pleckstrin-like domain
MKKIPFSLSRSRRSFIYNYILGVGLLLYILLSGALSILNPILTIFFISLVLIFFLEPEGTISYRSYFIKKDNITEISGFLSKRKITIPYSSIDNILVNKGVVGRLLGFGDVIISAHSSENRVKMVGVKHPEKLLSAIESVIKEKV